MCKTSVFLVWLVCSSVSLEPTAAAIFSGELGFVDKDKETKQNFLHSLHRKLPTGRHKPLTQQEMKLATHGIDATRRVTKSLRAARHLDTDTRVPAEECTKLLDRYLGKKGVERAACDGSCRYDPANPTEYHISCDFTNYCSFCAHDDPTMEQGSCYTLTHDYVVRVAENDTKFKWIEDVSYSACGIYHDTGRKACLDETYVNWGDLATRCVSVDGESCQTCRESTSCSDEDSYNYYYDCGNIEPGFYMDDCDYDLNDAISKDSVFVGFNYGLYADDTDSCFDDRYRMKGYWGNLGGTAFPTMSPVGTDEPDPIEVATTEPPPLTTPVDDGDHHAIALQDFRVVLKEKNGGPVVDLVTVRDAITEALFAKLIETFPMLNYLELEIYNGADYFSRNDSMEEKGGRDLKKKKKKTFYLTGRAVFVENLGPDATALYTTQTEIVSQLGKVSTWSVRKAKIVSQDDYDKAANKQAKKACKSRGGKWKNLENGKKACKLP